MNKNLQNDLLIRAAWCQPTERPPVWLMRQAGRYMPEYWEIKNKYSFLEMCKTPEIAADVTMLPVDLIDIDGAILFSDILVTPEAMGGELSFEQGVGPRFANPVRNWKDAEALDEKSVHKLQYVADAIKVIQERLNNRIPLIGFAGAPFTIMSYLVEGKSSRDFKLTKTLINNDPKLAHYILQKITDLTVDYLNMQIEAGVNAVQLFDSWAMALSWSDFNDFAHQYTAQIISRINRDNIPVISFARGSSVFYPVMAEAKPDVLSLDWNADILNVKQNLPEGMAIQGNFDPIILYADKAVIKEKIHQLFERMRGQDGFIFNLGHGIMPDMDFDKVKFAIETIKEFKY